MNITIDWEELECRLSNAALARMEPVSAYVYNQKKGGTMYVKSGEVFVDWYTSHEQPPSLERVAAYFEEEARKLQ